MAEQVMRVSNIGKKYKLMTEKDKHDTFVSVLLNSLKMDLIIKKIKVNFGHLKMLALMLIKEKELE